MIYFPFLNANLVTHGNVLSVAANHMRVQENFLFAMADD